MSKETKECDACGEQIPNVEFCPHCDYEQGLISWDWKEQPNWGAIEKAVNAINGHVTFEDVNMDDDQYYVRIKPMSATSL